MLFLDQAKKGQGNFGTYLLTFAIVIVALVIGNTVADGLAQTYLGFSIINIPDNVDLNALLSLMLLPFAFVLLAVVLCVKYLHKRPILSVFTAREKFDWKRFFTAFILWGTIMGIALAVSIAAGYPIVWNFNADGFLSLLMISLFLMPIQTTAEEVLLRGYLFQGFGSFFKKAIPTILLTGTLFGLLHWANPEVAKVGDVLLVYYIMTGIFLGVMTHMDDGLELSMGYHAVNNIFASLIVTTNWQAFQTDALFMDKTPPSFGWEGVITLVVLQPLLLVIFSKRYNWEGWKERLLK